MIDRSFAAAVSQRHVWTRSSSPGVVQASLTAKKTSDSGC